MYIGLFLLLVVTLFLPLLSEKVEHNIELFLFLVGTTAAVISKNLSLVFLLDILSNKFIYMIGFAVLAGGILFNLFSEYVKAIIGFVLKRVPIRVFAFFLIIFLGIISSIITAIIAALVLVEIVNLLPLSRKKRIGLTIISCFSIGLGAVLTPVGEPLATVVISKLGTSFWYLYNLIGRSVLLSIVCLALFGAWYVKEDTFSEKETKYDGIEEETYKDILVRTVKIVVFVIALELLGAGFKPIIDNYVINLSSKYLYWINISSAVLDNATLASAEISTKMSQEQIKAVLLGLLISGGMLIPGNIPNIISANKLKIKSSEWIKLAVPLGAVMLVFFFIILFFI
ncbi:MAG: DUF1646 family protein [Bacillota bacterium]|nr:DUF1646 family protein [Bacillota bacterium]